MRNMTRLPHNLTVDEIITYLEDNYQGDPFIMGVKELIVDNENYIEELLARGEYYD